MYPGYIWPEFFDMHEFISIGLQLSITNFIWQPPECETYRIDQQNLVSQKNWGAVSALNRWADRTDPGGIKRAAEFKKAWDERPIGRQVVILEKINRGQALQVSRI